MALFVSLIRSEILCFQAGSPEDVPPVITTPHHYLINIYRHSLYLVAVVMTEGAHLTKNFLLQVKWYGDDKNVALNNFFFLFLAVPPLFVIEFLHRVMDILEDYFSECNESVIKENYVIVYEVRTEVVAVQEISCSQSGRTCIFQKGLTKIMCIQLLDEMLDNGFPLATESNILKDIIKPPTLFRKVKSRVTGRSDA